MSQSASYSRIYLLTVWQEPSDQVTDPQTGPQPSETGWRFFLEDPHSGQRRGFANAVDLLAALLMDFEGKQPPDDGAEAPYFFEGQEPHGRETEATSSPRKEVG